MQSTKNPFAAPPFWQDGPAPGQVYNFPATRQASSQDYTKHSQTPITTTTSLLALKFNDGVVIAGDILGSYGSMARFRDCPRIMKVNENIILGANGDYADFQYVKDFIEQKVIDDDCYDDGFKLKPKSLHCWLTRIMYNRRSKFDPFWNSFIVGGLQDGQPFLGTVDKLGTAYEDDAICTGYGAYIALPLIRSALEANPRLTEDDAKKLIHKCLEVMYYRDARSSLKYQMAVVTPNKMEVLGPLEVEQKWDIANMI